jgi:UDP-glucose 4-epimerase
MKRILITGGSGFIGSYLVDRFLNKGFQIGVLDKNIPGYFSDLSRRVDFYRGDITAPVEIKLRYPYDVLIHLAAANEIVSKNALEALRITTYGTKVVLDFCVNNNLKKCIYFSTFHVYGLESGMIDEDTPVNCRNDYALSHYCAEEYVRMYHRNCGMEYIVLRLTNSYGAFFHREIDRWSIVPNCFCKEAFEKQTITLFTSGRQERDFINLEDVTNITALLCQNFDAHKNQVFNVSRGSSRSILDMALLVAATYQRLFGKECRLVINSDMPQKAAPLLVRNSLLQRMNYTYSGEHDLSGDIEAIFHLLQEK